MIGRETPRQQAERHVREGEERVARQRVLIEEMERDNHPRAASVARYTLELMEKTLRLSREHLELEKSRQKASEKNGP